jgi:uncharacterized membrane protein YqiK
VDVAIGPTLGLYLVIAVVVVVILGAIWRARRRPPN